MAIAAFSSTGRILNSERPDLVGGRSLTGSGLHQLPRPAQLAWRERAGGTGVRSAC